MQNHRIPILIAGATGRLGSKITRYCLERENLLVNILVRNLEKNKDLCEKVRSSGGKVIHADFNDLNTLKDSTKEIHTLISAVDCPDIKLIMNGQRALLEDGVKNGLKRFVPTDYDMYYSNFNKGQNSVMDERIAFRQELESSGVKGLYFYPGLLYEIFVSWIYQKGLHQWLKPDHSLEITSYDDTAKFIAAAVSRVDREGNVMIAGDVLTPVDIEKIIQRVEGKIPTERYGTLEELQQKIQEEKDKGEDWNAELLGFPLALHLNRGELPVIQINEFPEVQVTHFEDWLKQNPIDTFKLE